MKLPAIKSFFCAISLLEAGQTEESNAAMNEFKEEPSATTLGKLPQPQANLFLLAYVSLWDKAASISGANFSFSQVRD